MASQQPPPDGVRVIAPCPWCGPGTQFTISGDGMGGQSIWCRSCGCKGPAVSMAGVDFDDADERVMHRWGRRARTGGIGADTLERIAQSIALQSVMNETADGLTVPIAMADLDALLGLAGIRPAS